jgi:alginate O-acetyltransferase complex protein AlgI
MITMLLCGLWHGPSWNFVLWGGIHGIYLAVEIGWRLIVGRRKIPHAWYVTLGSMLLTFSLFSFTLIFFRADNSFAAIDLVSQILNNDAGNNPSLLSTWQIQTTLVAVFAMLAIHMLMRDIELEALFLKVPKVVHLLLVLAMILVMILAGGSSKVFIYFQF